jgi:phage terminase large subunit
VSSSLNLSPEALRNLPLEKLQALAIAKQKGWLPKSSGDFERYRTDLLGFIERELGATLWSKQREVVRSVQENPRTTVRSCHGIGKSFIASRIAVAYLYSHRDSIVITTAPTDRQVKQVLWREIASCVERAGLPGRCLTKQLELGPKWYATGLSTKDGDKFQGFHARDLLLIVDEAAGVAQEIYTASDGILTSKGAKCLLIGNPTSTDGRFFDSHNKLRGTWNPIAVSAFDSPLFTDEGAGLPEGMTDELVSPQWVANAGEDWGVDSPLYIAKVLGQFPEDSEDRLIRLQWIEDAAERVADPAGEVVMGVDVARQGNCETATYIVQGDAILASDAWRKSDFNYSSGRILAACEAHQVKRIRFDATGMGVGLVDVMKPEAQKRGIRLQEVFVGQGARDKKRFVMLRDELWWGLREKLKEGRLAGLKDGRTQGQLSSMKYSFNSRGLIEVESKDELTKRSLPSPDRADALCLAVGDVRRPQMAAGF